MSTEDKDKIKETIHKKYPVTRKLRDAEDARLQWDEMERVMDAILIEDYDRLPTIPEVDFVNYLLPKLMELGPDTDLSVWIKMAGSYDRAIRVVDNAGKELFTIPPIYGEVRTTIASSGAESISEAVEEMRSHLNNIPVYGEQLLRNRIRPKVKAVPISEEYIEAWYTIAERYGIPVKEKEDTQVHATKAAIFDSEEDL